MNENKLDFTSGNYQDCFIFENKNYKTNYPADNSYTIDNLKNYQVEGHIINKYNTFNDYNSSQDEQLNYHNKLNVNIFPEAKPIPLIYDSNIEKKFNARKKNENKNSKRNTKIYLAKKVIESQSSKNFTTKINSQVTSVIKTNKPIEKNFNINSCSKGLFDPNLKKNELDFPKKTKEQRKERIEKIKNYDLKFGSKVKKLQMYNNYIDMLEDSENGKMHREINKEKYKIEEIKKLKEEIKSQLDNLPKPKYKSNNLDFDFSNHEEVIKSLEFQIENERRMRAEIKLKYEQEKKLYEKIPDTSKTEKEKTIKKKTKKIVSAYGGGINNMRKNKRFQNSNKYFRNSKSVGVFAKDRNVDYISRRNNSADFMKNKIEELKPKLSDIIDRSFNTLFKNILQKKKSLLRKVYTGKNEKIRGNDSRLPSNYIDLNTHNKNEINRMAINSELNELSQTPLRNNCCISESDINSNKILIQPNPIQTQINNKEKSTHQINEYNVPYSPMCNLDSPAHPFHDKNQKVLSYNVNHNPNAKFSRNLNDNNKVDKCNLFSDNYLRQVFTTTLDNPENNKFQNFIVNIPNKITNQEDSNYDSNPYYRSSQNFNKIDKFEMLDSLNKQIDKYSKGLPSLMDKVETTLQNISKINIFDEKTHPIIKMASKHSGQIIQLHTEEICDSIIDDLLLESVDELEKIEEIQNKQEELKKFKGFIKDYYNNFELMRNFENEIFKNISNSNKFFRNFSNINLERENDIIYNNPFESFQNKNIIEAENILECDRNFSKNKFNPNIFASEEIFQSHLRRKYSTKLIFGFVKNIETYSKEYFDYMKTTGTFLLPNIFLLYDEAVKEFVNDILNYELDYCVKQLDNFVTDFYKEEIFKN